MQRRDFITASSAAHADTILMPTKKRAPPWCVRRRLTQTQHVFHHVSMNVGQSSLQAVVVEGQTFMFEAHQVQERGVEVVDGGWVDGRLETEFVAFPETEAAFDASTGQEAGECVRVVIAVGAVGLQERSRCRALSRLR